MHLKKTARIMHPIFSGSFQSLEPQLYVYESSDMDGRHKHW